MGDLAAGDHLSAGKTGVLLGRVDDKFLPGADEPAHIIGQTAPGIGDITALVEHLYFHTAVLPLDLGRGFCSGGHAADHQNTHHSSPLAKILGRFTCSQYSTLIQ